MARRFAILTLLLASVAAADTRYVVPNNVGRDAADAGATREDPMDIDYFASTYAQPGYIALLQPGSYGVFTFAAESGTNVGTSGNPIIYRADTGSCVPRSSDWMTRTTPLERPNAANHAVFDSITFMYYRNAGSWTDALPYYITLDGLWINNGYLSFYYQGDSITVQNCNIIARVTDLMSTTTNSAVAMSRYYLHGSCYRNLTFSNCYVEGSEAPLKIYGDIYGDITYENIHVVGCNGSAISYQPNGMTTNNDAWVTCRNVYVDGFEPVADDEKTATNLANSPLITAVDGAEPRRIFTLAEPSHGHRQALMVWNNSAGAYTDVLWSDEWAINETTNIITLDDALTFDIEVGVDKCRMMDIGHGSGVALRGGKLWVDRCIVKNDGSTRLLYNYVGGPDTPSTYGISDLRITNSLFINGNNSASLVDIGSFNGLGNDCWILHNTFVGCLVNTMQYAKYYTDHWAYYRYGNIGSLKIDTDNDASTTIIANNVWVGQVGGAALRTAVLTNNIYYDWANPTALGATNTEIYGGEAWGEEPAPFHKAGTYFVASAADFDNITYFTSGSGYNLAYDYAPKEGSPLIAAGNATYTAEAYGTNVDLFGNARAASDIGAIGYGTVSALAPTAATSLSPADGAVSQLNTVDLSWTSGTNTPTHKVYFGTNRDLVSSEDASTYKGEQANGTVTYDPGTLSWSTDYFWKIVETNVDGTASTGVYQFQTMPQPTPIYYLLGGT